MSRVKDQILRDFGDHGAETFERYFAQIEYTAYWCIRMLHSAAEVEAVIPEGVEDILVVQRDIYKLYQVKTRDESQGPWTVADVLPILCQQYYKRRAFCGKQCCFHFVSNQIADNKTSSRKGSYGSLYRLKELLGLRREGQTLRPNEQKELEWFEAVLLPKIQERLRDEHQDEVSIELVKEFLHYTYVETECPTVRNPNNSFLLGNTLMDLFPDVSYTTTQILDIYDRLLLLVMRKIMTGDLESRKIVQKDVLDCRVASIATQGCPDWSQVPGRTIWEKKARFGGFHSTELPVFRKQKQLAEWPIRRLETLQLEDDLKRLTIDVISLQRTYRDKVCREQGVEEQPGPATLRLLRPKLASLATKYFPGSQDVDELFCLGILWQETDACSVSWHGLNDPGGEIVT